MMNYNNGIMKDGKGFKFDWQKAHSTQMDKTDPMPALMMPSMMPSQSQDTVPAMMRPGEYVLTPEAVRHFGVEKLQKMNEMAKQNALSNPQHFAVGGLVNDPNAPGYDVYNRDNSQIQYTKSGDVTNAWDPNFNVSTGMWKTGTPGVPTAGDPNYYANFAASHPQVGGTTGIPIPARPASYDVAPPTTGPSNQSAPTPQNPWPQLNQQTGGAIASRGGMVSQSAGGTVPPPSTPSGALPLGADVSQMSPEDQAGYQAWSSWKQTGAIPAGWQLGPSGQNLIRIPAGTGTPPVDNAHPNQISQVPSTIAQGAWSPYDPNTWNQDPWYQWQADQGRQQMKDYLGSIGRENSTYGMNTMSDFTRGLNAQESQNMYNRWFGEDQAQYGRQLALTQLGYGAANQAGQMALNQGNLYSQYFNQAGQLQTQGVQTLAQQLSQMGIDYATALNVASGEYGSTIMQMLLNQGYAGAQNAWNQGNPTAGLNYMGGYNNANTATTAGNALSQIIQTAVTKSKTTGPTYNPNGPYSDTTGAPAGY